MRAIYNALTNSSTGVGTVVLYRKDFRISDLGNETIQSGTTMNIGKREKTKRAKSHRADLQIIFPNVSG